MNLSFKALLFAALSFTSSISCTNADIFQEMLTLTSSVEVPEKSQDSKEPTSVQDCIITHCKAQHQAFGRVRMAAFFGAVDGEIINQHIQRLQKCIALSCARR